MLTCTLRLYVDGRRHMLVCARALPPPQQAPSTRRTGWRASSPACRAPCHATERRPAGEACLRAHPAYLPTCMPNMARPFPSPHLIRSVCCRLSASLPAARLLASNGSIVSFIVTSACDVSENAAFLDAGGAVYGAKDIREVEVRDGSAAWWNDAREKGGEPGMMQHIRRNGVTGSFCCMYVTWASGAYHRIRSHLRLRVIPITDHPRLNPTRQLVSMCVDGGGGWRET